MTTHHAIRRTQERTGFNPKTSARVITNAIARGRSAETFPAKEREYLRRKESKNECRALVYNTHCFIVSKENICITMFMLPKWFGKKQYDGKCEIREAKKYVRFQDYYRQEDTEYGYGKVS